NINANRFVASTSSMDSKDMQAFADGKLAYNTFSPVFKPNGGNVINMGTINAKNVTLQGNKVMLSADTSWDDKNNKIKFNQITADNIDLKGNEVYVDISTINSKNLTTEANNKGIAYLSATGYYYNPTRKYDDIVFTTKGVMDKTYNQYISIGSDLDWWHFAKGWNEKADFRNNVAGNTFKLANDIDFGANCKNGVCTGQNYANYWVDLNGDGERQVNEFTSMIVGEKWVFDKNFDGQGFTLKNINIDATGMEDLSSLGIFGDIRGDDYGNIVNIGNINIDYMGGSIKGSMYAGGLCAWCRDGNFYNITISNIENIIAESYVGGFVGYVLGDYINIDNIVVDNIKNIVNMSNAGAGGFAGIFVSYLTPELNNITLKRIGNVKSKYGAAGGFIGKIDEPINANNISIEILGEIFGGEYAGGFAGEVHPSKDKNNFSNIYIYFGDASDINVGDVGTGDNMGIFIGKILKSDFYPTILEFENIFIYHHRDKLTHAVHDQNYWNKYNFTKYNDSTQSDAYKDFLSKTNTIEKPPKPTDPIDPTDPDAKLNEDDLLQEMIKEEIINDITNGKYKLQISDLLKMLEDKANYSKMSEDQKVEFVAKYFLSGDKTKALEVVQSLDFLLAYEKNGLSAASKDKFEGNGFSVKNEILSQVNNTTKNIKDKFNKLEKDLKPLVDESNVNLKDLIAMQNRLDDTIKAYNKYVDLINKGLASKNDPEFIALKNQIDILIKDSQVLADSINENQKELSTWQNDNNTENFKVVGAFANAILINPKLNEITNDDGNENDDYEKISRQVANSQKQTPVFEYEEEETEEVDETSLAQKSKTCIVSDNYKTMNPCVAGM
ncbi:TPA: hypothetical protein R1740_001535, partial [Campylobacter lari]|nr:hypothetical protein [Campylobacter lari]HEC1809660.1 hypothetical protein [Campylobacter lari]